MVLASAFMMMFISYGIVQAIGVYTIDFLEEFDTSVAAISTIGGLSLGCFLAGGMYVVRTGRVFSSRCH